MQAMQHPRVEWRRIWFGRDPRRTLGRVAAWAILAQLFFHECLMPIQIIGSSMTPTYRNGAVNLINRMAYTRHRPRRGDVVVLRQDGELLLKRIVGLPGETIAIRDGSIEINERPLTDKFARSRVMEDLDPVRLGKNTYFVIGDNRETSFFGSIAASEILGKVVF